MCKTRGRRHLRLPGAQPPPGVGRRHPARAVQRAVLDRFCLQQYHPYKEPYMEPLTKKTTILFTPDQHRRLMRVAEQRHTSLGELVRSACEQQYGVVST